METIVLNDAGTDLRVTVKDAGVVVNISTATDLKVILRKPGGDEVEYSAALYTDGTDGILHYQLLLGDITTVGIWSYRGKVTFSASMIFTTKDPEEFEVIK